MMNPKTKIKGIKTEQIGFVTDIANPDANMLYITRDNLLNTDNSYTKVEVNALVDAFSSGTTTLSGMTDVSINTPLENQFLRFNGSIWVNSAYTAGDVTEEWVTNNFLSASTSLFDGEYGSLLNVPDFDSMYLSSNTFIPTDFYSTAEADANFLSASTSLVTSLDDLSDVNLGTPITNDVLTYNGAEWIASSATYIVPDTYTKTECNNNFLSASTSLFDGEYGSLLNVPDFDSMYLSASTFIPTDFYSTAEADANFLSASTLLVTSLSALTDVNLGTPITNDVLTYNGAEWIASSATYVIPDSYTKTECDNNFLSANTALFDGEYSSLLNVPDFDSMYLSANTFIPTDFYSTAEADANFLSASTSLFDGDYGSLTGVPDFDSMYLSANTSFYTQAEADANFLSASTISVNSLSALTDVSISSLFVDDILTYSGTEWVNTAATWIKITNPITNNTLIYDGFDWVNTGISYIQWSSIPETSGSTGVAGTMAYDTGYTYICYDTNTWSRIAHNW